MFRFTDFINGQDTVRDVIHRHPQTQEVFEQAGVRLCCLDCSIRTVALRGGIDLSNLLADLNQAALTDSPEYTA